MSSALWLPGNPLSAVVRQLVARAWCPLGSLRPKTIDVWTSGVGRSAECARVSALHSHIHNGLVRQFSQPSRASARLLFVGCLTSQQHTSVSQGRICSDHCTCYHTEIEVADPTFHLTQSQYTDTGPTSPSADAITPDAWQDSHWNPNFKPPVWLDPEKSRRKRDSNPGSSALERTP